MKCKICGLQVKYDNKATEEFKNIFGNKVYKDEQGRMGLTCPYHWHEVKKMIKYRECSKCHDVYDKRTMYHNIFRQEYICNDCYMDDC